MFVEMMKVQVDKVDPVEGICSDIEDQCQVDEDGLIQVGELVNFFESVNWLGASKPAMMEIVDRRTTDQGKIDYRAALFEIVQD